MKAKNKVTAILAILMLTISIFAAFPFPVQAQLPPNPIVTLLDQFTAPSYPMNITVKHPENKTMIGDTFAAWVYLIPNSTTMKVSHYEAGFNITNPYVLEVFTLLPYTPMPGVLPQTLFGDQLLAGNATWIPGHYSVITGEMSKSTFALNTSRVPYVTVPAAGAPLFYIIFRVKWWGETWVKPTNIKLLDETGAEISPILYGDLSHIPGLKNFNGYFKMRRVFVELAATIWRDPPPPAPSKIGDTFLMPMSISNTEPINNWTATISYNTTLLSCNWAIEGPYLKVVDLGTSFTADWWTTPGVITATCELPAGKSRTGDGVLMYINFTALSYTDTIPVTHQYVLMTFQALDPDGNVIDLSTSCPEQGYPNPKPGYFEFNKLVYVVPVNPVGSPITIWQYPDHTIGETFNYYLYIKGCSQKVHSWKAGFRYDPKVLDCVSFTEGTYLSSVGTTTCTGGTIHHDTGVVESLNCTLDDPDAYATDDGLLAIVTFQIKSCGRTVIDLTDTDDDPCEAKLVDIYEDEIVSAWPRGLYLVDGVFELREKLKVKLEITGGEAVQKLRHKINYTLYGTIEVKLLIENSAERVSSWMSGFWFDPSFLNCTDTDVTMGAYLSSVGPTMDQIEVKRVNDHKAYVSISCTLLGALNRTGDGLLATITFTVIDDGHTHLNMTALPGRPHQTMVLDFNVDECTLLCNYDGTPFYYAANDAWVEPMTVYDGRVWNIGDLTGDGRVRITDLVALYNIISLVEVYDDAWIPYADVNLSGWPPKVTDLVALYNIISGEDYTLPTLPDC